MIYFKKATRKKYDEEVIDDILINDAETLKPFVRADDNSSRSNASSIVAQSEMKSEKAEAGLKAFKDYDYRVECEGKKPGSVDPIRLYVQKKRMQSILAISKRRKLSADMSELLTTPFPNIHTTAASEFHVLIQQEDNTSTTLATYDMPQNVLNVTLPEHDIP